MRARADHHEVDTKLGLLGQDVRDGADEESRLRAELERKVRTVRWSASCIHARCVTTPGSA